MGSTTEQIDRLMRLFPDSSASGSMTSSPASRVDHSALLLGIHQVTVGQFRRFVKESRPSNRGREGWHGELWLGRGEEDHGSSIPRRTGRIPASRRRTTHPVVCVSHNDAVAFCRVVDDSEEVAGRTYRLPSEAEWEYACRSGTRRLFLISNDPEDLAKIANVADARLKQEVLGHGTASRATIDSSTPPRSALKRRTHGACMT